MARNMRRSSASPEATADAQARAREQFGLIEQFLDRTAAGEPEAAARTRLAHQFAAQLGVSRATFYRLLGRHAEGGTVDALLPRPAGVKRDQQRLAPAVETIIDEEIRGFYLTRERPTLAELVARIGGRCHAQGLRRPHVRTIKLRIAAISRTTVHRKRYGGRAARERFAPVVGTLATERALQVVQIDHTKVDLFVVEETTREVLGRPWLTLAIDVHTRMIAGFYLSFDPPSVTSVAICLALAVADKAPWLAALGVDGAWPVQGIPERVHLDNGREFHAQAFATACARYAIPIDYRPVRTPHYGGHIERLIGTLMGRVHMLPGTTFSSVEDRQDYDSARHATLSLGELERWLALEIVGRYHASLHAALHMSPLETWRQAAGQRRLRMPPNPRDFLIDFLPFQQRRVRRNGVHLFNIAYWADALTPFLINGEAVPVHYDPRNLARVFVRGASGGFVDVPYRNDLGRPPISLWEQRAVLARLRAAGRATVDEAAIFAAITCQRALVEGARDITVAARREQSTTGSALATPAVHDAGDGGDATEDTAISPALPVYGVEEWSDDP